MFEILHQVIWVVHNLIKGLIHRGYHLEEEALSGQIMVTDPRSRAMSINATVSQKPNCLARLSLASF
jgi:hypothetical protein